jgi:hypothetical protein
MLDTVMFISWLVIDDVYEVYKEGKLTILTEDEN